MKPKLFNSIKWISTILISGAIGLEIWNLYVGFAGSKIPNLLNPVFWLGRIAISIHFIEGLVASVYAPSKQKQPIQYGIYTFFVGTVGLVELFDLGKTAIESRSK